MSNSNVGNVYQQIIRDVVESSRVDFEEGGVDEGVLEELSKGWQKKLSALGVAQFPWDPKPEPTPAPTQNSQPVLQNIDYQQQDANTPPMSQQQSQSAMPVMTMPTLPQMNNTTNGPRIKSEPGLENGMNMPLLPFNQAQNAPVPSGMTAQQRAAHNLQMHYGPRAAASIGALHNGAPQQQNQQSSQQQQSQQPSQQQRPTGQSMQRPQMTQQQLPQYQQNMANQAAQARNQVQNHGSGNGGINGAQTDGSGEPESFGVLTRLNADGEAVGMGRIEIDNVIRRRIEAMGQSMEGGGLMLPLHERISSSKGRVHRVARSADEKYPSSHAPPQTDGVDDDDDDKSNVLKGEDDLDEDAINSDLDDPDDGLNDDDDDDDSMGGHLMLCMYDKVQRVKNKWKCVMKDGVLTVNGKEYVFHKASGEYEW
ncbi:MAG: transcription factor IIA subunit alpha [Claussenomyces sp. TS43310]|nr:MAG: transcription factor IIA subunit alpha [Claussenomyces sp. TS43310]